MMTRWEVTESTRELHPTDFIYLQDGPRQGETVQAGNHTGAICLGLVAGQVPRLGAELIYEDAGQKTSEGARCYRLRVRKFAAE